MQFGINSSRGGDDLELIQSSDVSACCSDLPQLTENLGAPGCMQEGEEKKSVVAEHAWKEHHPIRWQETSVIDRASRSGELRVKEALHIHLTPEDQHFNQDVGLELPQGFAREATPTTIGLIRKGFSFFHG